MSRLDPRSFATASGSDVGHVRDANEDFTAEFERPSGHRLLVVADGMGGHRGGATASRLCVETIGDVFQRSTEEPEALLRTALVTANDRIYQTATADASLEGMGTTAVMLLLTPQGEAWVAHAGDSRAYLLRTGEIRPLTEDHTVVGAMVKRGMLTEEEAESHPRRHELIRCVGFHNEPDPDVMHLEVQPGDRFLLCSDGLSGQISDEEIAAILLREALPTAVETLVQAANGRGGVDNVTVSLAAVPGGATTVVDSAPRVERAAWLDGQGFDRAKHARFKRIAGATAVVAALLAIAMLWLTLGGG